MQWLGERLAPHRVRYEGFSGETDRETRWCIRFYDGPDVILHIPTHLVDGDDHAFEWITLGMESYDWKLVLRQASASYLTLNRNGMIWAMDPDE